MADKEMQVGSYTVSVSSLEKVLFPDDEITKGDLIDYYHRMTTGSKGLHVVAPLDRSADFDTVRGFSRNLAQVLARRRPDDLTTETRKNKRHEMLDSSS